MPIPQSAAPDWLRWLECCESTNSWATSHSAQLQHGNVVYTPQQTAGRGQQGRRWYTPPGGLAASFVFDNLSGGQLTGLSLVAGLAVVYAVEDLLPGLQGQLRLKWPNDVMAQGRKLAGVLCEATSNCRKTRVVIGVGLNHQVEFAEAGLTPAEVGQPISLHQICGDSPLPKELTLLERLRHYLGQASGLIALSSIQPSAMVLPELRRRDWLLDRQIGLQIGADLLLGQAAGIDEQGRLLLRQADRVRAFASGRVVKW